MLWLVGVNFINTHGQIHVPIHFSKCCPIASTRLDSLLYRVDGSFVYVSAVLRNYMATNMYSSNPLLVCKGWQLYLNHQLQRSCQSGIWSHLQGLHDPSESQISDRGDGLPRQAAWTWASHASCEMVLQPPSHFAQHYICSISSLYFSCHLWS